MITDRAAYENSSRPFFEGLFQRGELCHPAAALWGLGEHPQQMALGNLAHRGDTSKTWSNPCSSRMGASSRYPRRLVGYMSPPTNLSLNRSDATDSIDYLRNQSGLVFKAAATFIRSLAACRTPKNPSRNVFLPWNSWYSLLSALRDDVDTNLLVAN